MSEQAAIRPGEPVQLAPGLVRLTAPNPGVFTGPGTNTYLIGEGEVMVLDPGPDMPEHTQSILDSVEGSIAAIVVTHTHPDHSPGAYPLADRCGAPVLGMSQVGEDWAPNRELKDGDRLQYGGQTLQAVHTPGHASNHLCYLLESQRILLTGDHIMQGSTVVIAPPDGDMKQYIDSLTRLQKLDLAALAPGHGTLLDAPQEAIAWLIAHRRKREDKVLLKLQNFTDGCDLDQLVTQVYDDVDSRLHPIARASLEAHLLKLATEGRAEQRGENWHPHA